MKKIFSAIAVLALSTVPAMAQLVDCNATIVDSANILSPLDVNQIQAALPALVREQVLPHVITYNLTGNDTQETFLTRMQHACPSWQNVKGGLKGNIVVFMVSPNRRNIGIFPGPNYQDTSLNSDVRAEIKKTAIGPYFKSGNFGLGFANGIRQVTAKINDVQTAATRPVNHGTTIVKNEAPTDLSGLWKVLGFLLGLAALVGLIILAFKLNAARKAKNLAQLDAISARNTATSLLSRLSDTLREKAALGIKVTAAQSELDNVSADFATLGRNLQTDPTDNSLSQEAYETIAESYKSLIRDLKGISTDGDLATKRKRDKATKAASNSSYGSYAAPVAPVSDPEPVSTYREPVYNTPAPSPAYSTTPAPTTTVIHEDHYYQNNSSNDLLTGVLIGEELSRPSYTEPVYCEPAYTPEPTSSYNESCSSFNDDSSRYEDNSSTSTFQDDSSNYDSGSSGFDSGSSFDSGGGGSDF
jgi:uncharacterized membrane protein YgcG